MKTAISIPDEVFKKAERLAKRLRMSRSQLYSLAVAEFVRTRRPESITEAMNDVVDAVEGAELDELVEAASEAILRRSEW